MLKKDFYWRVVLVSAHLFIFADVGDACVWCDPRMTSRFTNCLFIESISNPLLDGLEDELLDMKNSLFSSAISMKRSPEPMKEQILMGALAGELSGIILSHAAVTGQSYEVAAAEIMKILGYCYFSITQQSEVHFVDTFRKSVRDLIKNNEVGDNAAVYTQDINHVDEALQTDGILLKNAFPNTDVPLFDRNYLGQSQNFYNGKNSASSFPNKNFGSSSTSAIVPQVQEAPLPNRALPTPLHNQDFDYEHAVVAPQMPPNIPVNPLSNNRYAPSFANGDSNDYVFPAIPHIQENVPFNPSSSNQFRDGFSNHNLDRQPSPALPQIRNIPPDNPLPNSEFSAPLTYQYFDNQAPSGVLPQSYETVPDTPSYNIPSSFNRNLKAHTISSSVPTNPSLPNSNAAASFSSKDFDDYSIYISKPQGFDRTQQISSTADKGSYFDEVTSPRLFETLTQDLLNDNNAQQSFGIRQPYESGVNTFGSKFISPTQGADSLNTYDTGQQTAQAQQSLLPTIDQNIPNNAWSSDPSFYNSKSITLYPSEQDGINFQPVASVPGNFELDSKDDVSPIRVKNTSENPEECAMTFSQTLFVQLLKAWVVHSTFGTETLPSTAKQIASEALRRAFIDNGMNEYADEVSAHCAHEVESLSDGSSTQEYADKISKAAADVLYKSGALTENCSDRAKFMALTISRWLETIEDEEETKTGDLLPSNSNPPKHPTNNFSENTASVNLKTNKLGKNDRNVEEPPRLQESEYEYRVDNQVDSLTQKSQNNNNNDRLDDCEDDVAKSLDSIKNSPPNTALINPDANQLGKDYGNAETLSQLQDSQNDECEDDVDESLDSTTNSSPNRTPVNLDANKLGEDNQNAENPSHLQDSEYEYRNDEQMDSLTQNDKHKGQYDDCEETFDNPLESVENPDESSRYSRQNGSMEAQESKLSNPELKRYLELLMLSAKNSVSLYGFEYKTLTSTMSSISFDMENKHPDWNHEKIFMTLYMQAIVALTQVLQETAVSNS